MFVATGRPDAGGALVAGAPRTIIRPRQRHDCTQFSPYVKAGAPQSLRNSRVGADPLVQEGVHPVAAAGTVRATKSENATTGQTHASGLGEARRHVPLITDFAPVGVYRRFRPMRPVGRRPVCFHPRAADVAMGEALFRHGDWSSIQEFPPIGKERTRAPSLNVPSCLRVLPVLQQPTPDACCVPGRPSKG